MPRTHSLHRFDLCGRIHPVCTDLRVSLARRVNSACKRSFREHRTLQVARFASAMGGPAEYKRHIAAARDRMRAEAVATAGGPQSFPPK